MVVNIQGIALLKHCLSINFAGLSIADVADGHSHLWPLHASCYTYVHVVIITIRKEEALTFLCLHCRSREVNVELQR